MQFATDSGTVTFESLWKTRRDNLVALQDMEDEHILNTVGYLEQRVEEEDGYTLPFLSLSKTAHNIEVLKRELIRRTE